MTVAINSVQEKESDFDKIVKGLNAVKSVTGLGVDYTRLKDYYDNKYNADHNIVSPEKQLAYGKDFDISNTPSPGAIAGNVKGDDGKLIPVYYTPKDKNQKPGHLTQQEYTKYRMDGAKEVSSGTPGSLLISHVGPNGDIQQHSLLPPPSKVDEKDPSLMNPNKRLAQAPVELRSKVGLIANALGNMTDYENAYSQGETPSRINPNTPLIGSFVSDTTLTSSQRNLDEAVGRLQSGGVIGKDELVTFRNMGPRPGDNDEIRTQKLAQQRSFLEDRLIAFGFSPEDLGQIKGYDSKRLGYDTSSIDRRKKLSKPHQNTSKDFIPNAHAGNGKLNFNTQDLEALEWVKKNPKHPDASAIKSRLQMKGLL